jgi:hypothetical protein
MSPAEQGKMLAASGWGLFCGMAVGYASHGSGTVAGLGMIAALVVCLVGTFKMRRAARPVLTIHLEGGSPQLSTYYLTVRNRSSSEIRVTRIWMDNCDPEVAERFNRGLPKIIAPSGSWEVKVTSHQPVTPRDWAEHGHALVSDGTELRSVRE